MKSKFKLAALVAGLVLFLLLHWRYAVSALPDRQTVELYSPHFVCLQDDERIINMLLIADQLTFFSYTWVIGPSLLVFVFLFRRASVVYIFAFILGSVFVFACGITHHYDRLNLTESYYYAGTIWKYLTGQVSILTAAYYLLIVAPYAINDYRNIKKRERSLLSKIRKMEDDV